MDTYQLTEQDLEKYQLTNQDMISYYKVRKMLMEPVKKQLSIVDILCQACVKDDAEFLWKLLESSKYQQYSQTYNECHKYCYGWCDDTHSILNDIVLTTLCNQGNITRACQLLQKYPQLDNIQGKEYVFIMAAGNGQLDVLYWLNGRWPKIVNTMRKNNSDRVLRVAFANKHFDVLKWLLQTCQLQFYADDDKIWHPFADACADGDLETAKWFVKNCPQLKVTLSIFFDRDSMHLHEIAKRPDVVEWLQKKFPDQHFSVTTDSHDDSYLTTTKDN